MAFLCDASHEFVAHHFINFERKYSGIKMKRVIIIGGGFVV
jgi:hypothetical protein